MTRTVAVAVLTLLCAASASAQKLNVKILNREDKEDEYNYAAVYNNVAVGKSFEVHGATFTLQLPDGRLAIVNCESKFAEHMAGRVGNRRSCRTPLVDNIQADFKGDKARLIWGDYCFDAGTNATMLRCRRENGSAYSVERPPTVENTFGRIGSSGR